MPAQQTAHGVILINVEKSKKAETVIVSPAAKSFAASSGPAPEPVVQHTLTSAADMNAEADAIIAVKATQ